jgi:hypothetical protein
LEERVAEQLEAAGCPFDYETEKLKYTVPARNATYTPDFILDKKIYIETKGWLRSASERQKMVLVKQAHPDKDIRLVFQNAQNKIYKGSPTTYAKWAEDHGFPWADHGKIPEEWIKEALDG